MKQWNGLEIQYTKNSNGWESGFTTLPQAWLVRANSKAKCIAKTIEILSSRTLDDVNDSITKYRSRQRRHKLMESSLFRSLFYRVFGTELYRYNDVRMRMLLGVNYFDAIKFDTWLQVPDGQSTWDVIESRFGKLGVRIIKELM